MSLKFDDFITDYTGLHVIRPNFVVYETMKTKTKKRNLGFWGKTDPKPNRLRKSRTVTKLSIILTSLLQLAHNTNKLFCILWSSK